MINIKDQQLLFSENDFEGLIAGVDEAGRGPLCGDVYAAAVILDPNQPIIGLDDSKKLTEKRRAILAAEIKEKAMAWAIASSSVAEIDEINILQATLLAMRRAVAALSIQPQLLRVDGNQDPKSNVPAVTIIKGDSLFAEISAASILAKDARDQSMYEADRAYPQYGFGQHKGYGTKAHLAALAQYGVTPLHRTSFAPIKRLVEEAVR
ncbi:ribonuclease HII [Ignatzschineria cameli]|uniref:Ribonuclease HII n=1 Tax=Ignatzschineria cameli TaxID=2182793 RepID=A0A2U2AS26_9GAMM|nr:ribonuclease HII [Ignatzschineria cameli]PWD86571.1 ribonuclease HII [Ignatzschineria cameli]PWD87076.1 ribonuclease HII [Ignatzschineria cameli]PWD92049.1 ribonuclease HII [Ignatzschineria cameli]PWD93366.1 ribonuclease HII [Ignatzschineria cameli]PWD94108.1 ribonuclease HII [Ignatzschineria cameli]